MCCTPVCRLKSRTAVTINALEFTHSLLTCYSKAWHGSELRRPLKSVKQGVKFETLKLDMLRPTCDLRTYWKRANLSATGLAGKRGQRGANMAVEFQLFHTTLYPVHFLVKSAFPDVFLVKYSRKRLFVHHV